MKCGPPCPKSVNDCYPMKTIIVFRRGAVSNNNMHQIMLLLLLLTTTIIIITTIHPPSPPLPNLDGVDMSLPFRPRGLLKIWLRIVLQRPVIIVNARMRVATTTTTTKPTILHHDQTIPRKPRTSTKGRKMNDLHNNHIIPMPQ